MRSLTVQEIETLAKRRGAKKIAVENFLGTLMGTKSEYVGNVYLDAQLYHWNEATQKAMLDGIDLAF